jgi:vacuolar-type H+-ATPase subunit H
MKKEETLHRIKVAEEETRRAKEAASSERDRILRDVRREGFELREALRKEAERRQEQILEQAEAAVAGEKEHVLAAGRKEAEVLRTQAETNLDRAVGRVIEKFKGAVNA